ncbi:MAG: YfhO family protein [Candidatus Woesebacteria bacterium]
MKKYNTLFLICILAITARFYPFLLGKTLFFGDNYSLLIPGKIFSAYWLRQRIFPLWNPYLLTGISWIGDINQSFFSASTLFFWFLSPVLAFNFTILFYSVLTFAGMYFFARRFLASQSGGLIAATVWVFSATVSGSLNNLTVLQSVSLIPWVLYCAISFRKKPFGIMITAVLTALMLLGGYPQFIPYVIALAALLSFQKANWKSWTLSWICIGSMAIGLTAFALLPFVENLQSSTRTLQTTTQASIGGLHIPDLLSFILPTFFADPQSGMKWGPVWNASGTTVPYLPWIGIFLFVLMLLQKKQTKQDLFFLCLCVLPILYAFASIFPFFQLIQAIIPLFKASRGPQLALVIVDVIASIWIADLLTRVRTVSLSKKWIGAILLCAVAFLALRIGADRRFAEVWKVTDGALHQKLSTSTFHTIAKDQIIFDHIVTIICIHLLFLGIGLFLYQKKYVKFLLILLVIEMQFSTSSLLFFAPNSIYPTWSEIEQQQAHSSNRILINNSNQPYTDFATYWEALSVRAPFSDSYIDAKEMRSYTNLKRIKDMYTPDWNMVYGVNSLNGYVAFVPKDVNEHWNKNSDPAVNFLSEIDVNDPKLKEWGVSGFLVDTWFPHPTPNLPILDKKDTAILYALPETSRFRLDNGTLVSKENISETPNVQKIQIQNAQSDSNLLIADRFDSNWEAIVNGKPINIENQNGMRKIRLEQGSNNIAVQYWPKSLKTGMLISLTTLGFIVSFLVWSKKRTFL